ncbi:uncharacterized protein LOC127573293 [Pristis pectinata]|uniref:uncharacterized protein LOC127573293 n=1 Tax=Pristis pectinata TaxID=685728 RepID=UPI00223E0F75|nr:uncharacterized protein LOC127573293 [Pristis pectinata]
MSGQPRWGWLGESGRGLTAALTRPSFGPPFNYLSTGPEARPWTRRPPPLGGPTHLNRQLVRGAVACTALRRGAIPVHCQGPNAARLQAPPIRLRSGGGGGLSARPPAPAFRGYVRARQLRSCSLSRRVEQSAGWVMRCNNKTTGIGQNLQQLQQNNAAHERAEGKLSRCLDFCYWLRRQKNPTVLYCLGDKYLNCEKMTKSCHRNLEI